MHLRLTDNQDDVELDLSGLEAACGYISGKFDLRKNRCINVIFIDDESMRSLNRDHRDTDSTTDVLSFSYIEDPVCPEQTGGQGVVGEVYISPATARKNAAEQEEGWSLDLELIILIIHGILHIFGYDHEKHQEKAEMYGIQDSLVHDIGNKGWNRC